MKIGESRASSQAGSSRATQVRSGGGGFAPAGAPAARGAAGLAGPASLAGVDALLALQESGDALHAPRRRAIRRGEEMLDILDDIKLSLLAGQLPKSRLSRLLSVVERQQGAFSDPRLKDVLDQIELRARVELAKFGTYTKG